MSYILFEIQGGIGKNIMATAVAKSIKTQYPDSKLIIVTAWKDVWLELPFIDEIRHFQETGGIYDTYVKDQNILVFRHDPYASTEYITRKKHLIEIWCDLFNIPCTQKTPILKFNPVEEYNLKNSIQTEKPLLVLQSNGGVNNSPTPRYAWARDLPTETTQRLLDTLSQEFHIFHIRNNNQFSFRNTQTAEISLRQAMLLIKYSKYRLLIDSFGQHAAAAFNLPSTVCWIANTPITLGYAIHDNIQARFPDKRTTQSSYLEPYDISGIDTQYPYDNLQIFDEQKIINSIIKQGQI